MYRVQAYVLNRNRDKLRDYIFYEETAELYLL